MTTLVSQTLVAHGHELETDHHSFGWLKDSAAILKHLS